MNAKILASSVLAVVSLSPLSMLDVGVGDKVLPIQYKELDNTKLQSLDSLKGKVVLYEFFAFWCPPCKASVAHVNQLIDKYGSKGFVVVAITKEPKGETQKFMEETKAKWILTYDDGEKTFNKYGITSLPTGFLVEPSGKIVWKGMPNSLTDAQIEELLGKVRHSIELPQKYATVSTAYEKGKPGEALTKLNAELAKPNLNDSDKTALEAAKKLVESQASEDLGKAKDLEEKERDFAFALKEYERLSKCYAGMEEGKQAKEAVTRIKGDGSLKSEIDAGNKVLDAESKIDTQAYQAAWKTLNGVMKSAPNSGAAAKAEKIQKEMQARGQYGYDSSCKECQKVGKACKECKETAKW